MSSSTGHKKGFVSFTFPSHWCCLITQVSSFQSVEVPACRSWIAQQVHHWPQALTARLATESFTDLTCLPLFWPQITKNKPLRRGCWAPGSDPEGQQPCVVLCASGEQVFPCNPCREPGGIGLRQRFGAPSVAPLYLWHYLDLCFQVRRWREEAGKQSCSRRGGKLSS